MLIYNHYIRKNEQNEIIKAFSNAFEEALEGDIKIGESEERHIHYFEPKLLNITRKPPLSGYKWKYLNNEIVEND